MFTTILCGECGGEYVYDESADVWVCIEGSCLHTITLVDVVLDEGETVCDWAEVLGYFTAEAVA